MTNEREWLDGLKAGDEVARTRSHCSPEIRRVVRTTRTLVVINEREGQDDVYEGIYQRETGRARGTNSWRRQRIMQPTQEVFEEIATERLMRRARFLRDTLTIPTGRAGLESFIAALTPLVPEKTGGET